MSRRGDDRALRQYRTIKNRIVGHNDRRYRLRAEKPQNFIHDVLLKSGCRAPPRQIAGVKMAQERGNRLRFEN